MEIRKVHTKIFSYSWYVFCNSFRFCYIKIFNRNLHSCGRIYTRDIICGGKLYPECSYIIKVLFWPVVGKGKQVGSNHGTDYVEYLFLRHQLLTCMCYIYKDIPQA